MRESVFIYTGHKLKKPTYSINNICTSWLDVDKLIVHITPEAHTIRYYCSSHHTAGKPDTRQS